MDATEKIVLLASLLEAMMSLIYNSIPMAVVSVALALIVFALIFERSCEKWIARKKLSS